MKQTLIIFLYFQFFYFNMSDLSKSSSIIVDKREPSSIRTELQNQAVSYELATLEYGDFILSSRIAVERKRGDDLVASIYDHRFFAQLKALKALYPCPVLILENPTRMFHRRYTNEDSVYGAIVYVLRKLGISIIPTETMQETCSVLKHLHQKETDTGFYPSIPPALSETASLTQDDQIYLLEGLMYTGSKRSHEFLERFGTLSNFLSTFLQTDIEYNRNGNPKGITGPFSEIQGIGIKFTQNNLAILVESFKQAKKERKKFK